MISQKDIGIREESPALKKQSKHYPANWNGKVPKIIRMLQFVHSDIPGDDVAAIRYEKYPAWTNQNGSVSAILENGIKLGVKPGEFEVIEWW